MKDEKRAFLVHAGNEVLVVCEKKKTAVDFAEIFAKSKCDFYHKMENNRLNFFNSETGEKVCSVAQRLLI